MRPRWLVAKAWSRTVTSTTSAPSCSESQAGDRSARSTGSVGTRQRNHSPAMSGIPRVRRVGVDAVAGNGVAHLFGFAVTGGPQGVEHGHHHVGGVGLEVAAEGGAGVAAAEPV